jgi:hypothetical protein
MKRSAVVSLIAFLGLSSCRIENLSPVSTPAGDTVQSYPQYVDLSSSLFEIVIPDENPFLHDEPYLWTYYIVIDADTIVSGDYVQIIDSPGHRNITSEGVKAGEEIPIPENVGCYSKVLNPIPLFKISIAGLLVIGWEEDNTPESNVLEAYENTRGLLNDFVSEQVDALNLDIYSDETAEALAKLQSDIYNEIHDIFGEAVHWYDPFSLDYDDYVGTDLLLDTFSNTAARDEYYELLLNRINDPDDTGVHADYRVKGRMSVYIPWTHAGVRGGQGWYVGDFNGDGKDDVIRYTNENGGAEVMLSNGGGFAEPVLWTHAGVRGGQGWYVGDFNGDGKDDIFRYTNENGGAEVLLSDGVGFAEPVLWTHAGVRGGLGWYVGDFDGDGKDDIFRYTNENGGAEVMLSDGVGFAEPVLWTHAGVRGGLGWYVGDFDGDGKDDIFRYTNENGGAEVMLSNGGGFAEPVLWTHAGVRGGQGWYIGDFNGDGKDDVLRCDALDYFRLGTENGGAEVLLSNGGGFPDGSLSPWTQAGVRGNVGWYVGDFNGDGKDDLIRYINKNGGADVLISNGYQFPIDVWQCIFYCHPYAQ